MPVLVLDQANIKTQEHSLKLSLSTMSQRLYYLYLGLALGFLLACQPVNRPDSEQPVPHSTRTVSSGFSLGDEQADMDTISIRLNAHALDKSANNRKKAEQLSSWWDSLPRPLKSQIQENKVDVQVVSIVRDKEAAPQAQEELGKTGQALEKIIGVKTDISYSVNTVETNLPTSKQETASTETSIILSRKVPVRLSDYSMEIFMRREELSAENVQTLQYWWLTLPEDLQDKIRRKELMVEITCYAVDKGLSELSQNRSLGNSADEHAELLADALQQMIGFQNIGGKKIPLGKLITASFIEPVQPHTQNATHYIKLHLRPNKHALKVGNGVQ